MDYEALAKQYGGMTAAPDYEALAKQFGGKTESSGGIMQTAGNLAAGAVRGAGSIGATLLSPIDAAARALNGGKPVEMRVPFTDVSIPVLGQDRRTGMDNALQDMGAQPDSLAFKGAKLGTEVAGTLGAGGLAANALVRFAPRLAAAAPGVIEATRSAGMSAPSGNMLARMAGGGISGGASAGLIDPHDAGTGAGVGALAPPLLKFAGKAGEAIGSGASKAVKNGLGLTTGVGAEPISQAFKAGRNGTTEFVDNMRGDVPLTDILDRAKQGLAAMRQEKSAEYRSGMIPIAGDKTVLNFAGIDTALQDAAALTAYKGQVKNDSAAAAVEKMRGIVDEWKKLSPADYHTPEGLDALKQKLGGVLEGIGPQERQARLAAGKVYNAAKAEIEAQAPAYAKVMKDYSAAADQISEIERVLSLGDKPAKDTAMRKLQSLMRNNVQTNYGNRLNLANTLESQGGVELMPSLAGQAMSSATPRSLSGQMGGMATMGAAVMSNPLVAAALPFQSPRLVGEAAYGLGRLSGKASDRAAAIQQAIAANPALQQLGPNAIAQLLYRSAPATVAAR